MQVLLGGDISKADERNRLQSVIKKAKRYGYVPRSFSTLDELRDDSVEKLFFSFRYNPNNVLHRLLSQPKNTGHNLRQPTHNLILPTDVSGVIKENSVHGMLFEDIYWLYVLLLFCLHFAIFHLSDFRTLAYLSNYLHVIFHCMLHVRSCHISIKVLTYLLSYLLKHLITVIRTIWNMNTMRWNNSNSICKRPFSPQRQYVYFSKLFFSFLLCEYINYSLSHCFHQPLEACRLKRDLFFLNKK